MDLLNFNYLFFLAYIIIGYLKSFNSGERNYLLFSLLGLLGLATNLLDYFVFTSNLELFLIHDIFAIGLYLIFFSSLKILNNTALFLFAPLSTLIITAFAFFYIDWPKSDITLYSKYGHLNTLEYLLFCLLAGITCLIICTALLIKIFKTDLVQLNLFFILFGIISFYIGDIIQAGLGIHFISDTNVHNIFSEILLTIRLFVSNGLIILGLLWKN